MTGWRQAVFIRQRRIDVIQRALSNVLDEESWSAATPRRLHIGVADASSRGWTMIVPELANFFLDGGGREVPRLCRLARELRCPAYEIDVRQAATTLFEVDGGGRMQISGAPVPARGSLAEIAGVAGPGLGVVSPIVRFGLLPAPDEIRDRIAALHDREPSALADYLGALVGFPAWTRLVDHPIGASELVYEPTVPHRRDPAIGLGETALAQLAARRSGTHAAIARSTPRDLPPSHDRRGTRPRSAARPRR
jgi:hypothetical protein